MCQFVTLLSAQSQDGEASKGMPTSQAATRRCNRAWRDLQQEEQPDTTEDKVIADYIPNIDYEGPQLEV